MNMNDIKPASAFAQNYGVKALVYGPAGVGKTPLINTAPNPLLICCEPGLLSMKNSNVPTYLADTNARVDEAFAWLFGSQEARKFDTIGFDSVSFWAERVATEETSKKSQSGNKVDGKAAYGKMAERVYEPLYKLYMMQYKHAYLIAKECLVEVDGVNVKQPYFPGQKLNTQIPYLYDYVLYMNKAIIPGVGERVALRTRGNMGLLARSRIELAELEPCDLAALFAKAMAS